MVYVVSGMYRRTSWAPNIDFSLGWLLFSGKLLLTFPDASSLWVAVGSLTEYESRCP